MNPQGDDTGVGHPDLKGAKGTMQAVLGGARSYTARKSLFSAMGITDWGGQGAGGPDGAA